MSFKKEIEQYLEGISVLEESFRKVKDLDTLPVSFFSTSLDILNQLKIGLYEMESSQLQLMTAVNDPVELTVFLGDKISKKIYADLTKSLTINQRFMFLRDLFKGNEAEMNQVFTHLNALQTLEEALNYLNDNHPFPWETDAGVAFKELMEKHFA
ncbi:MAG: hypothetical protein LBR97_03150 [Dysgonamonadaceae bacterium]|jgi:hypothetical protein|nr:hypothetical protein [Dysgonamonadaceae bacterium]